jgi:predicted ATP-binding protein involved in virulence
MKIEEIRLYNFRSASEIDFKFNTSLNLFVGVNGSGKSTILDALSICLSWLIKRIEKEAGRGSAIPDTSIKNDQSVSYLDIRVSDDMNSNYRWRLSKTTKRGKSDFESQLGGIGKLAEAIQIKYEKLKVRPVLAYYPINRVVGTIRPDIPKQDSLYNLDIYENALGGKTNYQAFFDWFRIQDDILNEQAQSRSKWIAQNRNWIKLRINRLIKLLKESISSSNGKIDFEKFEYRIKRFEKDGMLYEEPRFLFRELAHFIEIVDLRSSNQFNYERILHDLEYMFHKMSSLSDKYRDDLIERSPFYEDMIKKMINNFSEVQNEKKNNPTIIKFLWESFSFAILLSFWWLSEKGKKDLARILHQFLTVGQKYPAKWYATFSLTLRELINRELEQKKNAYRHEGRELKVVTKAIEQFVPNYRHLRVQRVPRPHMIIEKNGESFNLDQLSDGEKNLIALVGDIARRLAIGNPQKNNPLQGEGIILIDEIDLHLHPRWQRLVIPKLLEVFPNCQFFISTHSPQVINHIKRAENIFLIEQIDGSMSSKKISETYGMSLDRVVKLIMDDKPLPDDVINRLDDIFEAIERDKLLEAKKLIADLKQDMPKDPELLRAEMLIRRSEMKK